MQLTIDMPEETLAALRVPKQEASARIRTELAVRLYGKGLLGFGKARELAGLSVWEFQETLAREGIERHYDADDLREDLETLRTLG